MIDKNFLRLYRESIDFKDAGMLQSALSKRQAATELMKHDEGHYALGKANEAILLGHHIGDGLEAYAAGKEALRNISAFAEADAQWKSVFGFSPLLDCFGFIGLWAVSYEEAIRYAEQAERWVSIPNNTENIRQLKAKQKSGIKWWEMQYATAQNFYSRTTPERDAGKYAAGMSILHCILDRALKEQPGYEMNEDDIFNLLDDFVSLSLRAYNDILQKFVKALARDPGLQHVDGPAEQFIVFRNPVSYWLQLMPDCPPKWRSAFQSHYNEFMKSPFPIYPEMMRKIGAYFPDSRVETKKCPQCGSINSAISPVCIRCNCSFDKSRPNLPGCYAVVSVIIHCGITASLWVWAIRSDMKWYAVAIAVTASVFALAALPQAIQSLRNRKKQ
jgi:uncharacterized protein (DUF983 family)